MSSTRGHFEGQLSPQRLYQPQHFVKRRQQNSSGESNTANYARSKREYISANLPKPPLPFSGKVFDPAVVGAILSLPVYILGRQIRISLNHARRGVYVDAYEVSFSRPCGGTLF